ncbi:MAG TPA: ATP-binding protein, partial [Candidatus Thermoplasmatota archaeon]
FNRAAERIFGYTKDEVAGQDLALFLADGVLGPESRSRIFDVVGSKLALLELVARRKDGRRTVVELTLSKSTVEAERRITAVVRDVQQLQKTRREKAGLVAVAEAVNASQDAKTLCTEAAKALRGALDYEGLGIYLHDAKSPVLVLAGASYPKQTAILAELATVKVDPSDGSRIARAFLERRPQWVDTKTGIHASTPKDAMLPARGDSLDIAVPVFVGDDVVAVLTALTTTKRHTVEEELPVLQSVALHLALGMGQKLLFEQLQDTAKNLAVTNRELDAFIYTASHDLAEPLRSMSNFSQFLMEDYAAKLDPQANDYLRRIHEGALRMRALLDALLQVSRIRHKPLPFEKVDTSKVLGEVRDSLDAMIRDRKGELVVNEPMPRVWGQPTRVMEVFTNLVSNGLKFNESSVPRVDISATTRDGFVEFTVKDNGIGIPVKYQDRVFGLFTRLHPRNQYPGTGAGLAIVRTIVEQHGGQIRIDSKEGAGTAVVFTLPREPGP